MSKIKGLSIHKDKEEAPEAKVMDFVSYARKANSHNSQPVVQCPHCQTKFALESQVLAGVSEPKFHCSRCDHVFMREEPELHGLGQSVGKPAESQSSPLSSRLEVERTKIEDSDNLDFPAWTEEVSSYETTQSYRDHSYRGLEIPASVEDSYEKQAPHELASQGESSQLKLNLGLNFDSRNVLRPELDEDLECDPERNGSRSAYAPFSPPKTLADCAFPTDDSHGDLPIFSGSFNIQGFEDEQSYLSSTPASEWKGFLLLAAPLIVSMAILLAASVYLKQEQSPLSISRALLPTSYQPVPQGLFLKNARYRSIPLESGELIKVVSGKVLNQTSEPLSDVLIEAIAFDGSGSPIAKSKASLASSLAGTKIRALSPEIISSIQKQKAPSRFRMAAGEEADFAIAFVPGTKDTPLNSVGLDEARYFSARVHSVKH